MNLSGVERHPEILLSAAEQHALHGCFHAVYFATNYLNTET